MMEDDNLQSRVDAMLGNTAGGGRQGGKKQGDGASAMADMLRPNMDMIMEVNLNLTVELGRTRMAVRQVLDLQVGSVIELDRLAGEAVDVFVNNHMLARGEVVVVDDKFGVRITEIISNKNKPAEI